MGEIHLSFDASAGRIAITNTDGETVFDTDEGLFVVTDRLSGSVTLPQRQKSNGPGNLTGAQWLQDYLVGFCNSGATMVRGVFRVTVSGGGQGNVTDVGAFNANGTYMHYSAANPPPNAGSRDDHAFVANMAAYTFYVQGGNVFVREHVILCGKNRLGQLTYTITLRAPTFNYNLFVGTFV